MSLTLGISTSSVQFEIVLGENTKVLYNSKNDEILRDTKDIYFLINKCLENIGRTAAEITKIIVNIGPGGTSVVRTGVAFANGLAYSIHIPVFSVPSFGLIGFEAFEKMNMPVICTANSLKDNAYVGLFDKKLLTMQHGNLQNTLAALTQELDEFAVAGYYNRAALEDLLPNKRIYDSDIKNGNAELFIEKPSVFETKAVIFPDFVSPITEQSIYLYE